MKALARNSSRRPTWPSAPRQGVRSGRKRRLIAITPFVIFLCSSLAIAQDVELGQRLYRQGITASGGPLEGSVNGDITLRGGLVACAKCHRRSGFGERDGARLVPPITVPALFADQQPRRADTFRNLYQVPHPAATLTQVHSERPRPAYTPETLIGALSDGIDTRGESLDPLMPRFELNAADRRNLLAYLKTLAAENSPGVDATTIHFATVVAGDVDAAQRRAMLDVLHAYCDCHNLEVERYRSRPKFSPNYRDEFVPTYRKWRLHVWTLSGEPDTWQRQVSKLYNEQPVLAILSGIGDGSWQPVHEFCEQQEVPCVFPNTNLPVLAEPNHYTLYLSRGLAGEAEAVGQYIEQQLADDGPSRVLQIYSDDEAGSLAARTLSAALAESDRITLHERVVADPDTLSKEISKVNADPMRYSYVILWTDVNNLGALDSAAFVQTKLAADAKMVVSGSLGQYGNLLQDLPDNMLVAYPYELAERRPPRSYRVRGWLRARGIRSEQEAIQMNTYFAVSVADHALRYMVDHFSRDYFIESIEHETENALNPGIFPQLSLGPGQRFACNGCYLLRCAGGNSKAKISAQWIIP